MTPVARALLSSGRWVSALDPNVPETSDVNAKRATTTHRLEEVNVVALGGEKLEETVRMHVRGVMKDGIYSIVFRTPKGQPASFLSEGEVIVKLDDALRSIWEAGGSKSSGTKPAGDALRVSEARRSTISRCLVARAASWRSRSAALHQRRAASTKSMSYRRRPTAQSAA